jgi:integrase
MSFHTVNIMPRKTKYEHIIGRYFNWRLYQRPGGVWYADGRANDPSSGRHSLGTKNRAVALDAVRQLDLVQAVEHHLAEGDILDSVVDTRLLLADGIRLYCNHVARSRVTGGAGKKTQSRYKAIFDKFLPHVTSLGVRFWNDLAARHLDLYAAWLDGEGYAYRTEYIELTTIKQAMNHLIRTGHLPEGCRIHLSLMKPTGTDCYCWRQEEVSAILQHCRETPDITWLGHVLTALSCTGMRISELASLRWSDIDFAANVIKLTDETAKAVRAGGRQARQLKGRRSRSFPIHADLRPILERIEHHPDGRVFHGPLGGIIKPDTVRRTLINEVLVPLAGEFPTVEGEIGFGNGRLHSFRHYFCSTCANTGVPEQVVMQWLGHRDSAMVRHYYHLHDDEAQRQMKRVNFVGGSGAMVAAESTT